MADIAPALSEMNDVEIASDAPLTEAIHTKIGANVNALIRAFMPVGSVMHSLLTEAEFNSEIGSSTYWVLADGRDVSGSAYATLTGNTTIPDMRGRFLRGKNNGISTSAGDESGERGIGSFQASQLPTHQHQSTIGNLGFQRGRAAQFTAGAYLDVLLSFPGFVGFGLTLDPPPSFPEQTTTILSTTPQNVSSGTSPGAETTTRNICVNIFVRIN